MNLSGRIALVTGGGKGVGAAIAGRLAAAGARVALLGRDEAALARVAGPIGALVLPADVTDVAALTRATDTLRATWGAPHILVHNAGIAVSAPLASTPDETWERIFAVNVTAPFRLSRALVPAMVEAGFGRVVFVASNAGLTGYPYTAAYGASKHAMVGLMRALAAEFARSKVTFNAVCPGFIDTEMTERAVQTIVDKTGRTAEQAKKALADLNPQKRLVTVTEVAHAVLMLAAEEAASINGQAIAIDGGQVMS